MGSARFEPAVVGDGGSVHLCWAVASVALRGCYGVVAVGRPETEACYPRHWTRLVVRRGPRPARARQLFLRCHGQEVEVGRALNCEDKLHFIECFRKAAGAEEAYRRAA